MQKNKSIVIGTSIAPFDIEKQKVCVSSWIDNGFKVYSYNSKQEIEQLKKAFADLKITFVEIDRSAVDLCGKELPFIQDIIDGVCKTTEQICGYFNSDIYFDDISNEFYRYIYTETRDSVVVLHRNEINSYEDIESMNWTINLDGIDGFFIDKNKAKNLYGDWAFVQTVWDTFLLIMCKKRGIPVKTLLNPIAFHIKHKVRWDYERTQKTYNRVIEEYYAESSNGRREVFYDKYNLLYEYSQSIIYCQKMNYKTLFVVENWNDKQIDSIKEQKLSNYEIVIKGSEIKNSYDFIFEIKKNHILDPAFCRFAFYLYEMYGLQKMNLGCFFISNIENRLIFNQLNKNITQLKSINEECGLFNTVIAKGVTSKKEIDIIYPICFQKIDILNDRIVKKVRLIGPTYIMPAGYRCSEWYTVNRKSLSNVNIVGCLDNSKEKAGKILVDKKIYNTQDVLGREENYNLILCTKYYQNEIREQITANYSVRFVDADSILWIDENGEMYVFDLMQYKNVLRVR